MKWGQRCIPFVPRFCSPHDIAQGDFQKPLGHAWTRAEVCVSTWRTCDAGNLCEAYKNQIPPTAYASNTWNPNYSHGILDERRCAGSVSATSSAADAWMPAQMHCIRAAPSTGQSKPDCLKCNVQTMTQVCYASSMPACAMKADRVRTQIRTGDGSACHAHACQSSSIACCSCSNHTLCDAVPHSRG